MKIYVKCVNLGREMPLLNITQIKQFSLSYHPIQKKKCLIINQMNCNSRSTWLLENKHNFRQYSDAVNLSVRNIYSETVVVFIPNL